MDPHASAPGAASAPVIRTLALAPAYTAPDLVPLQPLSAPPGATRRVAGEPPAPPAVARVVADALDAIVRTTSLEALGRTASRELAPIAGADLAIVRATTACATAGELPEALLPFYERLPALARRAGETGSFAWERQGDMYVALFPLAAHGKPVGQLILVGAAGRVLHMVGATGLLLVLAGPLGLAVANLAAREAGPAIGAADSQALLKHLDREFHRAQRYRQLFSLVRIELPRLETAQAFFATLERELRLSDALYRLDGCQLALVLPGTPSAGAVKVALKAFRLWRACAPGTRAPRAGIAEVAQGDASPADLLARAEGALAGAGEERPVRIARMPLRVTNVYHMLPDRASAVLP